MKQFLTTDYTDDTNRARGDRRGRKRKIAAKRLKRRQSVERRTWSKEPDDINPPCKRAESEELAEL
jgi:hypothetical protein